MSKIKVSYQQNGGKSIILLAHDSETAQRLSAFCTELGKKLQTTNTNAQNLAKLKAGMVFSSTSINAVWRTWRRQAVITSYHQKLDYLKNKYGFNMRTLWRDNKKAVIRFLKEQITREKALFKAAFIKEDSLTQKNESRVTLPPKKHLVNYSAGQVFVYRPQS